MTSWPAIVLIAILVIVSLRYYIPLLLSRAAWIQQDQGTYDLARTYLHQAIAIERVAAFFTFSRTGLGLQYGNLGSLYKKQGKWRQAIEAYTIAVNCLEGTRNGKRNAAPYYSMLGEVYLANGYKLEGLKNLDKSQEFFELSAKTETGEDLQHTLQCLEKITEMRAEAQQAN